jgi:leucyl/phenylalanyl-tRNA--protein transferase
MSSTSTTPELPWIEAHEPLPQVHLAWNAASSAPGLLAAGRDLSPARLVESYSQGIFPWFSAGQPVLWWSPDPRMVLRVSAFRCHPSLRKTLHRCLRDPAFEFTFDRDFNQVIHRCSTVPRAGQNGTWIVPAMVNAYQELHRAGHAHSAEVWRNGELVAGLYFVALGHAIFGESMFTTIRDGSKMALACLVSVCHGHAIPQIDCQQNTRHLASLGAQEISRLDFLRSVQLTRSKPAVAWQDQSLDWRALMALEDPA